MATYKVIGKGVDGKYMDDHAREDVIGYILQDCKTPHHYVGGSAVNVDNALHEMTALAEAYHKNSRLRLRHSVIGFETDKNVTVQIANQIARQAAAFFGQEYQIIYAVHEDKNYLHIHLVMNSVSYLNGRKYHGDKKNFYAFINYMKRVVKPYGINFYAVSE